MSGTICLQGGGEFSVRCRPIDQVLVEQTPGPVVVTALAGAPGREYATANRNGVAHYRAVGAQDVVAAPDVREDPEGALAALRRARLLVLPGGSPGRLLRALTTTPVGRVVADLLADGGTVMGSSAGAMVLGGWTVLPEGRSPSVVPGLGLVPDVLVVPHWSGPRGDWLRVVEAEVPRETVVLGIPEESAVLVRETRLEALRVASRLVRQDRDLPVGRQTTLEEIRA